MAATSTSDLSGLFKEVYSDEIINLIPDSAKLVKQVPFETADKELGNKYHQPVVVAEEGGATYAAAGDGAFTLNASISMTTKDAQVDGYQIVLRATMDYETAAKASTGGAKAFAKATSLQVKNLLESSRNRLEIASWYGQSGLGSTTSTGSSNTDSTTEVVCITAASHAPMIWSGRKNAQIVFYDGSSLVSSSTDAIFTISAVDIQNRTLTVTGTSTGITALNTAVTNASKNLDIFWYSAVTGSLTYKEMVGINKIITNTGTLFNVDAGAYDLWKGNTYSAGSAALNLAKIFGGVATAVNRGLTEDVTAWVHPSTWSNLASDQAALRKYDASYSEEKLENGAKALRFHHMNGLIDVVGHGMIKGGDSFIMPMKRLKRIGSQDISFKTPGRADGDDIFLHTPDKAGFEFRVYTQQSIFIETPAKCVKITNIVNS